MTLPPKVVVLPGDGIGPEVTDVALRVAEAAGFQAEPEPRPIGWRLWQEQGDPLPPQTLEACKKADAVFLGAITSKPEDQAQRELAESLQGKGLTYRSPIVRLRQELGLYLNIRPVRGNGVDLVVFRENTEDLYAGQEARPVPAGLQEHFPGLPTGEDAAVSLRVITQTATRRLCEAAFAHAEASGRDRVTLVEKPNVLRATGGLVREVFQETAREHPRIHADELNVDAACALLVREPDRFQVVVATNLFGDILSDLTAELAGGLALAPSMNLGEHAALFEPVHGSAPAIAGKGTADPIGAVQTVALMARHLGQEEAAQRIERSVEQVLAQRDLSTSGMRPQVETAQVEKALLDAVARV